MKSINSKSFAEILHCESESGDQTKMTGIVASLCEQVGASVELDKFGNLFAVKGNADSFPCYAAHLDTVHEIHGHGIVLVKLGEKITGLNPHTMQQTGIGGDDKCGIYAALQCLETIPACKAVFFADEEIGCQGAGDCDLDWFADCRFVISADRRGNADFVTDISGPLSSKRFLKDVAPILKRHGYKHSQGAMADVMALRNRKIGISAANISAGYYCPHTSGEYIDCTHLDTAVQLMLDVGQDLVKRYTFIAPERPRWDDARFDTRIPFPDYYGRTGYHLDSFDDLLDKEL